MNMQYTGGAMLHSGRRLLPTGSHPPPLQLLGPSLCNSSEGEVRLMYRKGWALLAYLLLEPGRNHQRSELAALLWPGLAQAAGLTNLRQVLCDLRRKLARVIGPGLLLTTREWVRLDLDSSCPLSDLQWIDQLAQGECAGIDATASMQWLLECGELLEGWDMEVGDQFCFWLVSTRQWCQQQWRRALERLRHSAQQAGNWRLALECVRCQIQVDPWDETLHRQRMTLYTAMGQAQLALASYGELEDVLQRELGLLPQRETAELAGLIRRTGVPA